MSIYKSAMEFEETVADLMSQLGFTVEREKLVGGMRADITATKEGGPTIIIECKHYKQLVGSGTAQRVVAQLQSLQSLTSAHATWLLTRNGVTPNASKVLKSANIDHFTLSDLEAQVGKAKRDRTGAEKPKAVISDTQTVPKIFVAMPFRKDMYDSFYFGYRWAAEQLNCEVRRLDEDWHSGEIVEKLTAELTEADVIVGDTSFSNPNVMYEIGFATALQKHIILTCKSGTDLPFDIKGRNHIVYENVVELRDPLLRAIERSVSVKA